MPRITTDPEPHSYSDDAPASGAACWSKSGFSNQSKTWVYLRSSARIPDGFLVSPWVLFLSIPMIAGILWILWQLIYTLELGSSWSPGEVSAVDIFAGQSAITLLSSAGLAAFWEEVFFRGYLLHTSIRFLVNKLPSESSYPEPEGIQVSEALPKPQFLGVAVLVVAALFAAGHWYAGPAGVTFAFVAGSILCLPIFLWGSSIGLVSAIGGHVLYNLFTAWQLL